ncbi:MAG: hypothetical protein J1E85_09020 [Ruminococcus sp.]|nr:hypothetical protein [Ruminococcus sp.]
MCDIGNWIVGIISGLVSSFCFFVIIFLIKPKIIVADKICKNIVGNDVIYKIKIVNKSHAMLTNLNYSLYYKIEGKDGVHEIFEIPPSKSPIVFVDKYDRNDTDADYAVRISYNVDASQFPIKDNTKFVFNLIASHSTTGSAKSVVKEYKAENIIENGLYETGKSVKIINKR